MKSLLLALLFAAEMSLTLADSPPAPPDPGPSPAKKGPRMPPLPTPPDTPPAPAPSPDAVTDLPDGVEFQVIDTAPYVVAGFPRGVVRVREVVVPKDKTLILSGRHLDLATGKVTDGDEEIVGPAYVYRVRGAADGECDLMILPVGGTAADMIVRRIKAGRGAQPPPTPVDPVTPVVPPVVVTSFRVIFVYDTSKTLTEPQKAVMFGADVEKFLRDNCTKESGQPGFRRYSRNADAALETPDMKALWGAVKPQLTNVPCVAIEVNGKADILSLEATPAAELVVLKKYLAGGK